MRCQIILDFRVLPYSNSDLFEDTKYYLFGRAILQTGLLDSGIRQIHLFIEFCLDKIKITRTNEF